MRLFVALDPPPETVQSLSTALTDALSDAAPAELRWTPPEQWHLTLAFFGEVDESRVEELTERLRRVAARTPALELALRGAGSFGRSVLWCGVHGDAPALRRLAARCTAAGRRTGIAMEERPFRAHLTLGRARRRGADLRGLVASLSSYAGRPWTARELRLVRSRLGPPVVHETLATFALSAEEATYQA